MVNIVGGMNKKPTASQLKRIQEFQKSVTPSGMSYQQYVASMQSPQTPWDIEQQSIRSGGGGDMDYELDMAFQNYQNGWGNKANAAWLNQSDGKGGLNSDWYNPDMTRTDYAGQFAPSLAQQRATLSPMEQQRQAMLSGNKALPMQAAPMMQTAAPMQQPGMDPATAPSREAAPIVSRKKMSMFGNGKEKFTRQRRIRGLE